MATENLFLIEFLVSKIEIESSAIPVPQYKELGVEFHCGNFLALTLSAEEFSEGLDQGFRPGNGEFKCEIGKTFLFPYKSDHLIREMHGNPLDINLTVSRRTVGTGKFPWKTEFMGMVDMFENIGVVKSVKHDGDVDILDTSQRKVGSILLHIKMTCLGYQVETFVGLHGTSPVFVNTVTMTQFRCDKYNIQDNKINPISVLYNPPLSDHAEVNRYSWSNVFAGGEAKLQGFLNMMTADVEMTEQETIVNLAIDKNKKPNAIQLGRIREIGSIFSVPGELTLERLNRKLCKNKDCEYLKKFYEVGIGPNFKESGLGCYYTINEPSTTYGINNLDEKFSRFGPHNFYRRPKDPYQPYMRPASRFHGPHRIKAKDLCYCPPPPEPKELCCCCTQKEERLRGGAEKCRGKLCRGCKQNMLQRKPAFRPANGEFDMKIGKTCLFLYKPDDLQNEMQSSPLLIELEVSRRIIGSNNVNWRPDFISLIKVFDNTGQLKSASCVESTDMLDGSKKRVATIDMTLKLSCLGDKVETYFSGFNKEPHFMNPVTKTKYQCEKFSGFDKVSSRFDAGPGTVRRSASKVSILELFGGKTPMVADRVSIAQIVNLDDLGIQMYQKKGDKPPVADTVSRQSAWDNVSIVFRPPENKFFDLLNMVAYDQPSARGRKPGTTFADNIRGDSRGTELASERINKMLSACANPACPAARKFKEYGLGPLATGPGLGTLYKKTEPRKTYRLSNTYGVFTNYGPYGVFAKSEYPFFPPKEIEDEDACPEMFPCPGKTNYEEVPQEANVCNCCGRICRLRGGTETVAKKTKKCGCKCKHRMDPDQSQAPLRLRGGGGVMELTEEDNLKSFTTKFYSTNYDYNNISYNFSSSINYFRPEPFVSRLRGGGGNEEEKQGVMKSAMAECKPVMDQFDDILAAYRKALGPCGEATCPFSQNMVEKCCQRICKEASNLPCPCQETESCTDAPCQITTCPYKDKPDKKFGGCGSSKCPYAQYKLGLVDEDAELELALLPPAIQGKCGDPKCDYPNAGKLPPIHWDCPDPLPQGVCKNPNCPHQPPGLKEIKVPVPKAPCGSASCPYALPPPCGLSNCPFRQKPCPFRDQKKSGAKKPCCDMESSSEEDDADECCNPECPFKSKAKPDNSEGCNNPMCPYGQVQNPKKKKKKQACNCKGESESEESMCDSPECPLNRRKQNSGVRGQFSACPNPACPSKGGNNDSDDDLCDNPECPFRKEKRHSPPKRKGCENPTCPNLSGGDSKTVDCSNPNCPFKGGDSDSGSVCSSPECPALQGRKKQNRDSDDSLCDNPDCPFRKNKGGGGDNEEICEDCNKGVCRNPACAAGGKKGDYCDNPMCPFSKEYQTAICVDPFCPYGQPLPSCGIPNCPYEKKPMLYCPSPICPSKFGATPPPASSSSPPPPQTPPSGARRDSKEGKKRSSKGSEDKVDLKGDGNASKPEEPASKPVSYIKKKLKSPYEYSFGDQYPGVKIGHRECNLPWFRVPPRMGWLWNKQSPYFGCKKRRGWRPGAIEKTIAAMIRAHREAKGLGMLMIPDFGQGKKKKRGGRGEDSDDDELNIKPRPTLHVTKKDGAFLITMNPLKDPFSLVPNEDPYMECTPMQFKITKNKPPNAGEDALCHCNDQPESDSDDSELDIEFTPPAAVIHPDRFKKKKNVIHMDTQYNPADYADKKKCKKGEKGEGKKCKKGGGKAHKKKGGKKGK